MTTRREKVFTAAGLLRRLLSDDKTLCRFTFLLVVLVFLGFDRTDVQWFLGLNPAIASSPEVNDAPPSPVPSP